MYRFAFLVLAGVAGSAAAQGAAKPDPAASDARAPRVEDRSAFADYRPFSDEKLAPWRDVNDEVARVGGHAGATGHGKPAPAKPGAAPEAAKPPAGHGGHR